MTSVKPHALAIVMIMALSINSYGQTALSTLYSIDQDTTRKVAKRTLNGISTYSIYSSEDDELIRVSRKGEHFQVDRIDSTVVVRKTGSTGSSHTGDELVSFSHLDVRYDLWLHRCDTLETPICLISLEITTLGNFMCFLYTDSNMLSLLEYCICTVSSPYCFNWALYHGMITRYSILLNNGIENYPADQNIYMEHSAGMELGSGGRPVVLKILPSTDRDLMEFYENGSYRGSVAIERSGEIHFNTKD